jgi:hypothetical protein
MIGVFQMLAHGQRRRRSAFRSGSSPTRTRRTARRNIREVHRGAKVPDQRRVGATNTSTCSTGSCTARIRATATSRTPLPASGPRVRARRSPAGGDTVNQRTLVAAVAPGRGRRSWCSRWRTAGSAGGRAARVPRAVRGSRAAPMREEAARTASSSRATEFEATTQEGTVRGEVAFVRRGDRLPHPRLRANRPDVAAHAGERRRDHLELPHADGPGR